MISNSAQVAIQEWMRYLQDGDVIKIKGTAAYLYNSAGCEIDSSK